MLWNIKRKIKFFGQRLTKGWNDSETWDLDITIAKFIVPRLKRFRELNNGFPNGFTMETWGQTIDHMVESFEMIIQEKTNDNFIEPDIEKAKQRFNRRQEGLILFGKYFHDLWW